MSAPQQDRPRDPAFSEVVSHYALRAQLPLLVKGVFDLCGSNAFESSHLLNYFFEEEQKARQIQNFATEHGIHVARGQWPFADIFMSAVIAAIQKAQATDFRNPTGFNHIHSDDLLFLESTVSTAREAFYNTCSDQRFVGATDSHHVEVQQARSTSHHEGIERPDKLEHVGDTVQQTRSIQRSGVKKRVARTRKPLPYKTRKSLEAWFQQHLEDPYPSRREKEQLATICGISMLSLDNWLANKRMRVKRKVVRAERSADDGVEENVFAPQARWKAVVLSKMISPVGRKVVERAAGHALPLEQNDDEIEREGNSV